MQTKDAFGNNCVTGGAAIAVAVSGPNNESVKANVKDNKDGTYDVDYLPKGSGDFTLDVKLGGANIKDAPFKVKIVSGKGECVCVSINVLKCAVKRLPATLWRMATACERSLLARPVRVCVSCAASLTLSLLRQVHCADERQQRQSAARWRQQNQRQAHGHCCH